MAIRESFSRASYPKTLTDDGRQDRVLGDQGIRSTACTPTTETLPEIGSVLTPSVDLDLDVAGRGKVEVDDGRSARDLDRLLDRGPVPILVEMAWDLRHRDVVAARQGALVEAAVLGLEDVDDTVLGGAITRGPHDADARAVDRLRRPTVTVPWMKPVCTVAMSPRAASA